MSERQEATVSESLKVTASIWRILKESKNYSTREYFIDKAI